MVMSVTSRFLVFGSVLRPFKRQSLCLLLTVTALTACKGPADVAWSGYAEGDYVYVAAPLAGQLQSVSVSAGQTVAPGDRLFQLESTSEAAARSEAAERLSSSVAQAANLDRGKRAAEIAVIQAQLAQAEATAQLASEDLARQQKLLARGFVAASRVESADSALQVARARIQEMQANLRVAQLPARTDERAASRANTEAARDVLRQSQWRQDQKQQTAPVQALVSEVFFQPGEFVNAGQPVVALLPPNNTKARFFVAENELAPLHLGQSVQLRCDACSGPIAAHISRIATQPEYTPPVIYSNAQRVKLVYAVEALPDTPQQQLKPGQPLDVTAATPVARP